MSMQDFLETIETNRQPDLHIPVVSRPDKSSTELMDSTSETAASQRASLNEGLTWGDVNSNWHGFVNFCLHALGVGVKGRRSHDNRDDFTIT